MQYDGIYFILINHDNFEFIYANDNIIGRVRHDLSQKNTSGATCQSPAIIIWALHLCRQWRCIACNISFAALLIFLLTCLQHPSRKLIQMVCDNGILILTFAPRRHVNVRKVHLTKISTGVGFIIPLVSTMLASMLSFFLSVSFVRLIPLWQ